MKPSRIRVICIPLMTLMIWLYGGARINAENYAVYANRVTPVRSPESRFDALLAELKDVVKLGGEKTKASPEKGFADIGRLLELKKALVEEHEKNEKYFDQLEGFIKQKKLADEVLNRQADYVRDYNAKYKALMENIESLESAHNDTTGLWARITGKTPKVDWDGVVGKTLSFLETNTARPRERHFDPQNLPHRALKADKPIPPKLTREEWLKAFAKDSSRSAPMSTQSSSAKSRGSVTVSSTAPPTPADLAETIEVKFTPEIRQLADSLGKNPVKIFNWVRNNIEFTPTWGSIQGAELCMENRAGNAFDTASLLIALLRYSGIPARYQMGTVEVPIDKFMNWAGGFTNAEAAASLFAGAGIPSVVRRVNQTGQLVSVKIEHVWVKAYVDYAASGGSVNRQGDSWIEMDPSFKQLNSLSPVDLSQFVRLTDAQSFLGQVLVPATVNQTTGEIANMDLSLIQSTIQPDQNAIFDFINGNYSQESVREIIGDRTIAPKVLSVLAASLPYKVITAGVGFAAIPASLRHSLEITITDPAGVQQLAIKQSLPEISGARVVLGYVPASDDDRLALKTLALANRQTGNFVIPTSLINVKPQLRFDDQVFATGGALRMGTAQRMQLKFDSPTINTPVAVNDITAGEVFAIAIDVQQVSPITLGRIADRLSQIADEVNANPSDPNISLREFGDLVFDSIALGWYRQIDLLNRLTAQMFGVVSLRSPSLGIAFSDLKTNTLFGAAYQARYGDLTMDIDQDVVVTVSKSGSAAEVVNQGLVMGMLGSELEASAPAQVLHSLGATDTFWLATTSSLAVAQLRGDTIVALDKSNVGAVAPKLGFSAGDLSDIQDAINADLTVMTHERPLRDGGGNSFLGYIQFDPQTGSGAYIIGGSGGAQSVDCFDRAIALPADIVTGMWVDVGKEIATGFIEDLGGPGGLVGKVISIVQVIQNLSTNLDFYNKAVSRLGESAKPLLGLVLLISALDALKELLGGGALAGAYLGMVSWTAFKLAGLLINHLVLIEAAADGIQLPSDCLP